MNIKLITIIEIIYLFYMFLLFKTTFSIHHPYEYYLTNKLPDYFKHPVYTGEYENKICPFGKISIIFLILLILIRFIFINQYNNNIQYKKLNIFVIIITLFLSLMNINALIYIIPFIFLEFILLTKPNI